MIDKVFLKNTVADMGIVLSDTQLTQFDQYAGTLVEVNRHMNLTAITEPRDIVIKHFADSLTILNLLPDKPDISLIDIGTGAGFPGIPIKIARPDIHLTLLDSLQKRVRFLEDTCALLGFDSAQAVHGRAEEVGRDKRFREQFDIATARAVANLPVLCEYALPFVSTGGAFIAMKGPDSEGEAAASKNALCRLGGQIERQLPLKLADGSGRRVFFVKKISQTPTQYPRNPGKIKKSPL